jgi:hypothetical protein
MYIPHDLKKVLQGKSVDKTKVLRRMHSPPVPNLSIKSSTLNRNKSSFTMNTSIANSEREYLT